MDYDEWGDVLADSQPGFQPFGFAGGLYDRNLTLEGSGARDYEAGTGRWTRQEPMMKNPRTVAAYAGIGVHTHSYVYAASNPLHYVDPTGLDPISGFTLDNMRALQAAAEAHPFTLQNVLDGIGAALVGLFQPELLPYYYASVAAEANDGGQTNACGYVKRIERGVPPNLQRHAHGTTGNSPRQGLPWTINEDGTVHDGNYTRIPEGDAEYLRSRGFDIPPNRFPRSR